MDQTKAIRDPACPLVNRVTAIRLRDGERYEMSNRNIANEKNKIIRKKTCEVRDRERLIAVDKMGSEGREEEHHGHKGETKIDFSPPTGQRRHPHKPHENSTVKESPYIVKSKKQTRKLTFELLLCFYIGF